MGIPDDSYLDSLSAMMKYKTIFLVKLYPMISSKTGLFKYRMSKYYLEIQHSYG